MSSMSNAALVSVLFTHLKTSRPLGEGIVVNATAANLYGHQDEILGYSKLDPQFVSDDWSGDIVLVAAIIMTLTPTYLSGGKQVSG